MKKFSEGFSVVKQMAKEKMSSETEISETAELRDLTAKVKTHQATVAELDRRLQRLSRAQAANVDEIKQIITAWTEYADRLSQAAEHPELERCMRKAILMEKYVEEIGNKLNEHLTEKTCTPIHTYVEDDVKLSLKTKERFNHIRLRYDALAKAKPGSKEEKERAELRQELDKAAAEATDHFHRALAKSEVVHFDALVARYEGLAEFFDLGQIYMGELKHDITVFKQEAAKRRQVWLSNPRPAPSPTVAVGSNSALAAGAPTSSSSVAPSPAGTYFGIKLEPLLAREKRSEQQVPLLVAKLLDCFTDNRNLDSEGIFRVSPAGSQLEKFKAQVNRGDFDFSWVTDPNVFGGGLKFFLRQLPEPLLTFEKYSVFLGHANKDKDETLRLEDLRKTLESLPPAHYTLARELFRLLKRVVDHSDKNKMGFAALTVVVGPNILYAREQNPASMVEDMERSAGVLTLLIKHSEDLFRETSWWKALQRGDLELAKRLAQEQHVDVLSYVDGTTGFGAVHVAARIGSVPALRWLIEELHAPVDAPDSSACSPLQHALINKQPDAVLYLVHQRANTSADQFLRDRTTFEQRAAAISDEFAKRYAEEVARVRAEDTKKHEDEAARKREAAQKAEQEALAKARAEQEEKWKRDLEIQQKREARLGLAPSVRADGPLASAATPPGASPGTLPPDRSGSGGSGGWVAGQSRPAAGTASRRDGQPSLLRQATAAPEPAPSSPAAAPTASPSSSSTNNQAQEPPLPSRSPAAASPLPARTGSGGSGGHTPAPASLSSPAPASLSSPAPSAAASAPAPAPVSLAPPLPSVPITTSGPLSPSAATPPERLAELLRGEKLNLSELVEVTTRIAMLLFQAPTVDIGAVNGQVRLLAQELRELFAAADGTADVPEEARAGLTAAVRGLQERLKPFITAMKELNSQPDSLQRLEALKSATTALVAGVVDTHTAFEQWLDARLSAATHVAAGQLTQLLQVGVGKAPPESLPALHDQTARHFTGLVERARLRVLELGLLTSERERLTALGGAVLAARAALVKTVTELLEVPRDEALTAALGRSAKELAGAFNQLNQFAATAMLHRTLSEAEEAEGRAALERDVKSLRTASRLVALQHPELATRLDTLVAALAQLQANPAAVDVGPLLVVCEQALGLTHFAQSAEWREQARGNVPSELHAEMQREAAAVTHAALYLRLAASVALSAAPANPPLDLVHALATLAAALNLLLQNYSSL